MSGDLDLEIENVLVEMKELSMEWRFMLEERDEEKRSLSNLKTKHSLLEDKLYKVHSKHTKPGEKNEGEGRKNISWQASIFF